MRVKLTCPICHELMEFQAGGEARREHCTYCESEVTVPPRSHLELIQSSKQFRTAEEIGEYSLEAPVEPAVRVQPTALTKPPEKAKVASFSVRIPCPTCGHKVGTRQESRNKRVNCPNCGGTVEVPAAESTPVVSTTGAKPMTILPVDLDNPDVASSPARSSTNRTRTQKPKTVPRVDDVPVAAPPPQRDETIRPTVFDTMAAVKQTELPSVPESTFFSNVFEFPWQSKHVLRWAYMSAGFTLFLMIAATTEWVSHQYSGFSTFLVLGFFALPLIWVGFLSFSYSAANFLCVVEGTAGGMKEISEWPEPNWREWMIQLIYLLWIGAIPLVFSFAISSLIPSEHGSRGVWTWTIFAFIYPIGLMSALEANSIWSPITPSIALSLVRKPVTWLTFYALTGLLTLPIVLVIVLVGRLNTFLLALMSSPLFAAEILIFGRLFGRLAWSISNIEAKWAKRRPKPD